MGSGVVVAALAWLVIPLVAAVLAALWARWASHTRATGDGASLAGYERFRQAMQNEPAEKPDTEAV
jgi:ABC-type spermidine/putrescine transport system permease subunit II